MEGSPSQVEETMKVHVRWLREKCHLQMYLFSISVKLYPKATRLFKHLNQSIYLSLLVSRAVASIDQSRQFRRTSVQRPIPNYKLAFYSNSGLWHFVYATLQAAESVQSESYHNSYIELCDSMSCKITINLERASVLFYNQASHIVELSSLSFIPLSRSMTVKSCGTLLHDKTGGNSNDL